MHRPHASCGVVIRPASGSPPVEDMRMLEPSNIAEAGGITEERANGLRAAHAGNKDEETSK